MTMRLGPSDDDELVIMKNVRRLLSQLKLSPRRAAVSWIMSRFETWPLIDRQGKLIDGATEHEGEPPILEFISKHGSTPTPRNAGEGDAQVPAC